VSEEKGQGDILSVKEAAELTGYSEGRVTQLLRQGKLQGRRIANGRKWLILRSEIDRWLKIQPGPLAL
jgi:excisionase family DNA binding protein